VSDCIELFKVHFVRLLGPLFEVSCNQCYVELLQVSIHTFYARRWQVKTDKVKKKEALEANACLHKEELCFNKEIVVNGITVRF
jgi:hypothetical protein